MRIRRLLALLLLGCALAPAGLARATITPDARKVLDRYIEISGGHAAWEQTRTLHFKGTLKAFGLQGPIESWRRAPDRRASSISIGPFTIRDWSIGEKAWRTDPSGKLLPLDGKDLEDALSNSWFENERWLEPDQGGGSITVGGDVKDSLGARTALEVAPPRGRSRRLEFDRTSGRLVRVVSKNDQRTVLVTNSDFRKMGGWLTPFQSVQEVSGASANTATVVIDQFWTDETLADDLFAPPASMLGEAAAGNKGSATWLRTENVARIPFGYHARHVWVRASINGGPVEDFLYDTGASVTVIDSVYAAKIGLQTEGKMQAQGAGSSGGASFAKLDKLRIVAPDADGVELHDLKVAVLDINSSLAPFFWKDCAGVIGFDVIVQFVNQLDYDERNLYLYDPASFHYSGKGTAIPMTLGGHTPVVNVKVDGQYEGAARIDVGSSSTIDLHTPFVKKYGLAAAPRAITVTGGGFGGTFQSKLARLKTLEIGPFKVKEPLIGLSTTEEGALASEDYAGNIGNRLLERFRVTLDYERRTIHLEPGKHFDTRESFSMLGAQFARLHDRVTVAQVLKGSPAAKGGMAEGDRVTAIDGKPIAEFDPDALSTRFDDGKPGDRATFEIERGGKKKTVKVRLKEIL